MLLQNVHAQEVDLDTLCQKFPLNSRCQGYKSPSAAALGQAPQVIKMKLETSGPDNEWIRIEMSENTVKVLHTTRSNRGISKLFNGVLGAVSPVPLPGVNFSKWNDHATTRVAFESDSCSLLQRLKRPENSAPQISQPSSQACAIVGTDSVFLAQGMDIRRGRFTIEYTEGNLLRSINFRIPAENS